MIDSSELAEGGKVAHLFSPNEASELLSVGSWMMVCKQNGPSENKIPMTPGWDDVIGIKIVI